MKKDIKNKPNKTEDQGKDKITRRNFISRLWPVLGVVAGVEIVAAIAGFLSPPNKRINKKAKQLIDIGMVSDFRKGTVTPFKGQRFFLARLKDGGFLALSLRCTHLGCSVAWHEKENRFICPCHSSSFDIAGNVLNPPAPKSLEYYPIIIERDIVKVDIGRIKKGHNSNKILAVYV